MDTIQIELIEQGESIKFYNEILNYLPNLLDVNLFNEIVLDELPII
jgi:hypothetical protein